MTKRRNTTYSKKSAPRRNSGRGKGVTAIEPETPVIKYAAVAVGVIIVCFLLGYFVLGPSARPPGTVVADGGPEVIVQPTTIPAPPTVRPRPPAPSVQVEERTEEVEARRKKEEERRKAEEEKRRAREKEEEEKRRQEEKERREAEAKEREEGGGDSATGPDAGTPGETTGSAEQPGGTEAPGSETPAVPVYRVRVGPYDSRSGAQDLAVELNGRGYATYTVLEQANGKTVYFVQVGAHRDEATARELQKELKANGYDASVSLSSG